MRRGRRRPASESVIRGVSLSANISSEEVGASASVERSPSTAAAIMRETRSSPGIVAASGRDAGEVTAGLRQGIQAELRVGDHPERKFDGDVVDEFARFVTAPFDSVAASTPPAGGSAAFWEVSPRPPVVTSDSARRCGPSCDPGPASRRPPMRNTCVSTP